MRTGFNNKNWINFDSENLWNVIERKSLPNNGCLIWQGYCSKGYPQYSFRFNGKATTRLVHRVMYMDYYGPIPDGKEIDHLCKNTKCVNLLHLEAVYPRENTLRSSNPCSINSRKEKCKRGHYFDVELYDKKGRKRRYCKTCIKYHQRKYIKRIREQNERRVNIAM